MPLRTPSRKDHYRGRAERLSVVRGEKNGLRFAAVAFALIGAVVCFGGTARAAERVAQRIISLSPNVTEISFALGLEKQIVGVTDFCKYPPEAHQKPKVGNLLSPNLEAIIALKPDLIIMLPSYETTREKLTSLKIPMLEVKNDRIKDVLDSISAIGAATGRTAEAHNLAKQMRAELARIAKAVAEKRRVRVLFVVDHNPGTLQQIYAAAPGTFIDDMVTAAGGENVLKRSIGTYPIISKEEIVALDPEVILDASNLAGASGRRGEQQAELWTQLPPVSAVKNGRVVVLADPALTIPGVRIAAHVEYFKRLFHPALSTSAVTPASDPRARHGDNQK